MQELSLKSGGGHNFRRGRNLGTVRYVVLVLVVYLKWGIMWEYWVNRFQCLEHNLPIIKAV